MATNPREIPQRELRNNIGEVLREVEAGAELRITVSGRPVAELSPIQQRRHFVPTWQLDDLFELPIDDELAQDLAELDSPADDGPWPT